MSEGVKRGIRPEFYPCSFCYTGSKGVANIGPHPMLVAIPLRDGPDATPAHPICPNCFEKKLHLRRNRCQWCGKLSSLLRTSHDSMTNKWVDIRVGDGCMLLCDSCQKELYDGKKWSAELKIKFDHDILTDDDLALLRRLWKIPGWKKCMKMPNIRRTIDDA